MAWLGLAWLGLAWLGSKHLVSIDTGNNLKEKEKKAPK